MGAEGGGEASLGIAMVFLGGAVFLTFCGATMAVEPPGRVVSDEEANQWFVGVAIFSTGVPFIVYFAARIWSLASGGG